MNIYEKARTFDRNMTSDEPNFAILLNTCLVSSAVADISACPQNDRTLQRRIIGGATGCIGFRQAPGRLPPELARGPPHPDLLIAGLFSE